MSSPVTQLAIKAAQKEAKQQLDIPIGRGKRVPADKVAAFNKLWKDLLVHLRFGGGLQFSLVTSTTLVVLNNYCCSRTRRRFPVMMSRRPMTTGQPANLRWDLY